MMGLVSMVGFQSTIRCGKDRLSEAELEMNLGSDQLNQGSIDMAMNHYHKSVQLAPTPAGYFNIGVCYFQMGKHKDAIASFEKSLALDPNAADAHTNIASAYLMMSDVQPAITHLEKASNFNPLDGEVQYNLGCVYEATGKMDDAKTRFQRALDLGVEQAAAALDKLNSKAVN
jgi:tetratricopeptide (TPR) repeat protein